MKNNQGQDAVAPGGLRRVAGLVLLSALVGVLGACRDAEKPMKDNGAAEVSRPGHGGEEGKEGGSRHADEVKLTPDAVERYGIKVEPASIQELTPTFLAPARVAFNAETIAHVGSPLAGRIRDLRVRLGDPVQKGDVLLVIESPALGEAQSEFLQKRIMSQTAASTVELAKSGLDRATRLYDQNRGISFDEVQKREIEYKSAQATALTAQSAVLAAENKMHLLGMTQGAVEKLRDTGEVNPAFDIVAPLAGRVVEREVTKGELVGPEKEALVVVADTTVVWVLADVPESRLPQVAVGAKAWVRSGPGQQHRHEGAVSYISPMIDPRTRSAQVRIEVRCEHDILWPGMFLQVELAIGGPAAKDVQQAIAIPEEAVQTIEGGPCVFVPVEDEPDTFARRSVRIGPTVGSLVPVFSGLKQGEMVVMAGSFILKAELGKASAEHAH